MEQPDFSLEDQVALVTGASKGVGRDVAKALSAAGAQVAVAGRSLESLNELVADIEETGGTALAIRKDVTDVPGTRQSVGRVGHHFGSLDVLVNNAGLGANHHAGEVTGHVLLGTEAGRHSERTPDSLASRYDMKLG